MPNRSEHKHRAIQQAGTEVFLDAGYEAATMETIAAKAGVSKQTVYNHFQSKDGLFKATVADLTSGLMAPLVVRERGGQPPERLLHALAVDYLTLMLQPSSLALHRLVVAEAARFPELVAEIYAVGTGRMLVTLADYLAWETQNGRLTVAAPALAAEQFVGLLTGRLQLRALLGVAPTLDAAALRGRADDAVAAFLAIYGPSRPAG
ncbi:MAG: TetR/AcrR family transcriptional regulator [Bacteroidota bacterium]|nr:TetR/AcrR family transcriptional regulator [Kiloniellaceae bacterium]